MDDLKWILYCLNKWANTELYAERVSAYQSLIRDKNNKEDKVLLSVETLLPAKENSITLDVIITSIKRNFSSVQLTDTETSMVITDIKFGWQYPFEKEYQDFKKTIHPEGKGYLLFV